MKRHLCPLSGEHFSAASVALIQVALSLGAHVYRRQLDIFKQEKEHGPAVAPPRDDGMGHNVGGGN